MERETLLPAEYALPHQDRSVQGPAPTRTAEPPAPAAETRVQLDSSTSFESFLAEVEQCVPDAGQLLLFTGEHLRLEVMLLRHEKNPQVIWGLKRHEDWAFKATLLRFARGSEPVHLVLSAEGGEGYQLRGWVVKRSVDTFWAAPLPAEQTGRFWERCLTPFSLKNLGVDLASDRAKPSPKLEPLAEP